MKIGFLKRASSLKHGISRMCKPGGPHDGTCNAEAQGARQILDARRPNKLTKPRGKRAEILGHLKKKNGIFINKRGPFETNTNANKLAKENCSCKFGKGPNVEQLLKCFSKD